MHTRLYKTYNVPSGAFIAGSFDDLIFIQGAYPNPPAWFEWSTTGAEFDIEYLNGYRFTAPTELGTYEVFFTNHFPEDDPLGRTPHNYKIVINVYFNNYDTYGNCCETENNKHRNLTWLGIHGGWQNYIFTGVKTFRVDIGRNNQFKTNEYVIKHAEINGVYDGEIITSGDIPKSHVDLLDGLKYSIQAFLYNEETEAWDIPILVDLESFTKYKSRDNFFEVRLKFIYAEEIVVQSQ